MTFESDKTLQQNFNRTSHQADPRWRAGRPARRVLLGLSIGLPCLLMGLCLIFRPFTSRVPLYETLLVAFFLPEWILLPVTLLRYHSDRAAFRCASSGRYGDRLLFSEQEMVYTYYNQRDSVPHLRHEIVIPYRLIEQALVIPERQILRIQAGGRDTIYDARGALMRESCFRTGAFHAKDCSRWVEIPLTYKDNGAFLQEFQQKSGISPATGRRAAAS